MVPSLSLTFYIIIWTYANVKCIDILCRLGEVLASHCILCMEFNLHFCHYNCNSRGFTSLLLWFVNPLEGSAYILHGKPFIELVEFWCISLLWYWFIKCRELIAFHRAANMKYCQKSHLLLYNKIKRISIFIV